MTKNKYKVDFKTIKSIRVALSGNDVNYPERVFLASDLPLLKKSLQKKLSTYENDIQTIEKLKTKQKINLSFSEVILSDVKEINESVENLSSMLKISYNIKNKETERNYCSNKSLLEFLNTERKYDKLLNIINSLLKKELSIEFSSSPVFSSKNNNKYYSSVEEFKHNRVEELNLIIQSFLINIQDPNSVIFHYSQLYSKKELRKLKKNGS